MKLCGKGTDMGGKNQSYSETFVESWFIVKKEFESLKN